MIADWRLLADEDFDNRTVRGVLRRLPELHFVTNQQVGITGYKDNKVLAWAESNNYLLVSHDVNTLSREAYRHLEAGKSLHGLFLIPAATPLADSIEEIVALVECSQPEEWAGQVIYLPL